MIIPINDKYRINSDKYQWIVQKYSSYTATKDSKTAKAGELVEKWDGILFYTSLSSLAAGLSERMLRESKAEGLAEAMEEVKRVSSTLSEALAPHFEVKA